MVKRSLTDVPSLKEPLARQLDSISKELPSILPKLGVKVGSVFLVGSVSRGEATYRSDVDLWVFIHGVPDFEKVSRWRNIVEGGLPSLCQSPLPVQVNFLSVEALQSKDNALQKAIQSGLMIYKGRD